MAICNVCGGEIEFRYIDGRPKPIHVNGGWCSGSRSGQADRGFMAPEKPFTTVASFINPNAHCPVCGDRVYYYQSPYGGRVFFNDIGWPWDKHGCTDNPRSQQGTLRVPTKSNHHTFRSREGEPLNLYELAHLKEKDDVVHLQFRRIGENRSFRAAVPIGDLKSWDITIKDLKLAPSFVVKTYESHRVIEFISGRKQSVDRFVMKRPKPTTQ